MEREVPPYLRRYRERRRSDDASPPRPVFAPRPSPADRNGGQAWTAPATLSADQLSAPQVPVPRGLIDLHLVRHGETQSYAGDAGLTPRGEWQSRQVGMEIAREVRDGERVRLVSAPTARASVTAEHVRLGIEDGLAACGRAAAVLGPDALAGFGNFQVWTPDGTVDPTTAVGHYEAEARRRAPGPRPLWQLELGRFQGLQRGGGDPIGFWLTMPLLTFEAPALVVRRFWEAAMRLAGDDAAEDGGGVRYVCCTHSGPMRAFAAWALGHDAGEPYNCEQIRVRVWPGGGRALVTYRTRTQEVGAPPEIGSDVSGWEPTDGGSKPHIDEETTGPGERGGSPPRGTAQEAER